MTTASHVKLKIKRTQGGVYVLHVIKNGKEVTKSIVKKSRTTTKNTTEPIKKDYINTGEITLDLHHHLSEQYMSVSVSVRGIIKRSMD
jgi:hypothetical protein